MAIQYTYVILDQSGSMYQSWNHAKMMAQALFANASANHQFGFITFNDKVHHISYFEDEPAKLNALLAGLSPPSGVTELVDAVMTSVAIDFCKPGDVYLISDLGENSSEVDEEVFPLLNKYNINYMVLSPPKDTTLVAPVWLMKEPKVRVKVLDRLQNVKRLDLRAFVEPKKLMDAMNEVRLGRIDRYIER